MEEQARGSTHLSEARSIDGLGVVLLAEVQVVHVEGAARNADPFRNLIVLLQPGEMNTRPVSKPQSDRDGLPGPPPELGRP